MLPDKTGRDALVVAAGPLGSAFFSILLTFVVSWTFAPEILGVLATLELVALFFVMVFTFGLDQAYVREFAVSSDKFSLFAVSVMAPVISATAATIVLLAVLSLLDIKILPEAGNVGNAIALSYGLAALVIRMLSVSLRMGGAPHVFAGLQAVQRGATTLILALLLLLSPRRDLPSVMSCYLAGAVISMALHVAFRRREVGYALVNAVDGALLRSLLRFGIPAATAASLYVLLSSSDRLSLAFFGSNRDLGIYAVALSIAGCLNIFTSVFAILWAPLVYKNENWARDPSAIAPYLDTVTLLTFLAASALAMLSWFLPFLFPGDYAGVAYFVPACMALPLFYILSETFGIGIGVSRRMSFATLASAVAAAVALGVSFFLVPEHGAKGAAFGILAGGVCFLVARTELGAVLWYRLPSRRMYIATATYCLGCTTSLLFGSRLGWLFPSVWIVLGMFCLILFRPRIGMILSLLGRFAGEGR